jgi:hypothetical protein
MTWVVALFGIAIAAFGLLGVVRPGDLIRLIENAWRTNTVFYVAIASRLVLGAALLAAATDCRFPLAFRILGFVSLVGAAGIAVFGIERSREFVRWWFERPAGFIRGWAMAAVAFGAFLVYAAV